MQFQEQVPSDDVSTSFVPNQVKPYGSPIIRVLGVGGGGSNAVNRMYKDKLPGVDYFVINTDAQHLSRCDVPNKLAIGHNLTRGLGVGGNPDIGRQSAEESREQLQKLVQGADMVFLAAGMGGGTGTGCVPVVAQLAKEAGALTIAVVTKPFGFEVAQRRRNAEEGLTRLKEHCDTLITVPNDALLKMNANDANKSWEDALKMADQVLQQGIASIAEIVTVPGEINVDFADIRSIMRDAGQAWLAIGKGKGENRAVDAAKMATQSPLLDIAIEGAKRVLFVISGGPSLTLKEVQQAAEVIHDLVDEDANVIFGTSKDSKLDDEVRVTLVAASFPMQQENLQQKQEELRTLLRDTVASNGDELEIPSFLRKEAKARGRGLFG
ncbi:MAG: cell division protein FtsZ [SAR202 cluster bacterium]|nr:cell division protein FtsZ [SAR202 cluster bacterium]